MKRSGNDTLPESGKRAASDVGVRNVSERESSSTSASSGSSSGAKQALRRRLYQRKLEQLEKESKATEDACVREKIQELHESAKRAGYRSEVRAVSNDLSPFPSLQDKDTPPLALIVYPSQQVCFHTSTGPFEAVRFIVYPEDYWRIDSPIFDFAEVSSGKFNSSARVQELEKRLKEWFCGSHVLCPGLIGLDDIVSILGYTPKGVKVLQGSLHATSCKVWHSPAANYKAKRDVGSDPRWVNVCGCCLVSYRYVKRAVEARQNLDAAKRSIRQRPSSNYPHKFLSPTSKAKRFRKLSQQLYRLEKHVRKLYSQTKVELPQDQSEELCQLIDAIENSEEGRQELENIYTEGNKVQNKEGGKGGELLRGVWNKDKGNFFKDQLNNVSGSRGNRWSTATIRVALAVYNRSPSAYEALRGLNILKLPHSRTLKKVIKSGSENPGIDDHYLQGQKKPYEEFQNSQEEGGHPRPLGVGVMMWDEVKIQMKIAWNLKGGGITGYSVSEDELKVLHDVYSAAVQTQPQKASYIVQFIWRDLTSGFDLVGPYFPVESSIQSGVLQEFITLCLKAFSTYGFRVSIMLCDGASSNLAVLKLLSGNPKTQFPLNLNAQSLRERYYVDAWFVNPEDPYGNPIFLMICPSHQLKNMIAALYSSRPQGSKDFTVENEQFGWPTIEKIFSEELMRAEKGLSRKVPGLRYAYVYHDNWTRLNVRPAKIMQQRFMIAAVKDLADLPNHGREKWTAEYLEACNLMFEQGLLSHRRINNANSQVLSSIRKGISFFEEWCHSHEQQVYPDNSRRGRQRRFLAWQTWDLLRLVIHGFLKFCEWFFEKVSPNGQYFISPLRINGSAIESIYSVLKFASGGNLSSLSYGPALGRLINRKEMLQINKYSEKGYRDVTVDISGTDESSLIIVVNAQILSDRLCIFSFPPNVAQGSLGGRQGSNACTIISVIFGSLCMQHKLDISLLWSQLPNVWVNALVNAICDGNAIYDELYGDTAVLLDVEDVVTAVGNEINIQNADHLFGFNSNNQFSDLVDHINNMLSSTLVDHFGVLIGCDRSVGVLVKSNGMTAIIDSHMHTSTNSGAMVIMGDCPRTVIIHYVNVLAHDYQVLNIGTLTWVQYA